MSSTHFGNLSAFPIPCAGWRHNQATLADRGIPGIIECHPEEGTILLAMRLKAGKVQRFPKHVNSMTSYANTLIDLRCIISEGHRGFRMCFQQMRNCGEPFRHRRQRCHAEKWPNHPMNQLGLFVVDDADNGGSPTGSSAWERSEQLPSPVLHFANSGISSELYHEAPSQRQA